MNKLLERFLHFLDNHIAYATIFNFLVVIAIASVVPLLLFGIFAIFFVATGGFPHWIWLIPLFGSVAWYIYFFYRID